MAVRAHRPCGDALPAGAAHPAAQQVPPPVVGLHGGWAAKPHPPAGQRVPRLHPCLCPTRRAAAPQRAPRASSRLRRGDEPRAFRDPPTSLLGPFLQAAARKQSADGAVWQALYLPVSSHVSCLPISPHISLYLRTVWQGLSLPPRTCPPHAHHVSVRRRRRGGCTTARRETSRGRGAPSPPAAASSRRTLHPLPHAGLGRRA